MMAEQSTDAALPILMKIQDSIGAIRMEIADFRRSTEPRFERVEAVMHKQRRDAAGMLVMMRATVTDFDDRVREVEERATALESKTS